MEGDAQMEGPNCKTHDVDVYNFRFCGVILSLNSECVAKLKSRPDQLKTSEAPDFVPYDTSLR